MTEHLPEAPRDAATAEPGVLVCRGLARSFPTPGGSLRVLADVELSLGRGEVAAVLGPSGVGKTTLLHLLAGLDRPDAGEIWWQDLPVHARPPRDLAAQRARRVGLVFQNHHLLEDLTLLNNVTLPGRILGRPDQDRGRALLAAVGLDDRAEARPRTLSAGERQRGAVARALYGDPPLLLADEPTGSLDRANAHAVFELLVRLARERGRAVLMVTHDEGLVADVDARYRLEEGRLLRL